MRPWTRPAWMNGLTSFGMAARAGSFLAMVATLEATCKAWESSSER